MFIYKQIDLTSVILDNLRQYDWAAVINEVGSLTPHSVGVRVFHLGGPRKLNDMHSNLEGV